MLSFLKRTSWYLVALLTVAVGSLLWFVSEYRGQVSSLEQLRSAPDSARLSHLEDDELAWTETASTVDHILEKLDFWQDPLAQSEWHFLRNAHGHFHRRLQRPLLDESAASQRLVDLSYMARVSFAIRQFSDAENALQESVTLADSLVSEDASNDVRSVQAMALNSLSCLLVNYGDLDEARNNAQRSAQILQQLLTESPDDISVQMLLAFSLRNAGVIEELLGRDGVPLINDAAAAVDRIFAFADRLTIQQKVMAPAFLADSHQMAGYMSLQHDRYQDAETAWLLSQKACEAGAVTIQELAREVPALPPQRRFRKGIQRLENDLQLLRSHNPASASEGSHSVAASDNGSNRAFDFPEGQQWLWTPLLPGDGANLLAVDRLLKGSLPAEFERQDAILMSWVPEAWNERTQLDMVAAIQETTPVVLLVADDELRDDAIEHLQSAGIPLDRIEFVVLETDTIWSRDYGPTIVRGHDGAYRVARSMFCDSFNDPWASNDAIQSRWSRVTGWPIFNLPVLVESGALLSNGAGLCIASSRLLKKNEASGIREPQVTAALKRLTGANELVFLEPLQGERTQHVDWFAVFTSPTTVVIGDYYGIDDVNAAILDANAARLSQVVTPHGPLQAERIPMPPHGKDYFGGTYTNVVFANGNLLVPTWPEASSKTEEKALAVYRRLLPDWKIIPINSLELGRKAGSLHCATKNLFRFRPPLLRPGAES